MTFYKEGTYDAKRFERYSPMELTNEKFNILKEIAGIDIYQTTIDTYVGHPNLKKIFNKDNLSSRIVDEYAEVLSVGRTKEEAVAGIKVVHEAMPSYGYRGRPPKDKACTRPTTAGQMWKAYTRYPRNDPVVRAIVLYKRSNKGYYIEKNGKCINPLVK